jgi:ubiquinone biosynthesis protein
VRRPDHPYLESLARRGFDLNSIARTIYWNALNQILRDGVFHGDLSPAGLIVLPGNNVAYVDFAVVSRISEDLQVSLSYYLQSIADERIEEAAEELIRWTEHSSAGEIDQFRGDLVKILEDHVGGFRSPSGSAARMAAHRTIVNIMSAMRRHGVAASGDLAAYFTAMLTTESVVLELNPSLNILDEQRLFLARAARVDILRALNPANSREVVIDQYLNMKRLFRSLETVRQSGESIAISLQKLRVRLVQYGLWTVFVGAAAYISYHDEAFHRTEDMLGLGPYWIPGAFIAFALILVAKMWHQGRRLVAMDRTVVTESDVSFRSFGRVR